MKTSVLFATFSIIALSIFLVWAKFNVYDHDTAITVNEDTDSYVFTARYDRRETGRVESFINKNISPDRMGSSPNDYVDANTRLNDNTRFYIKESPGKLKIKLDKTINTVASCYRIRKMCKGVKELLAGK
jgi:hypothetical protein